MRPRRSGACSPTRAFPRHRSSVRSRTQVRLRVEERRPVAILLAERPLLVAGDGVVFPSLDGEATQRASLCHGCRPARRGPRSDGAQAPARGRAAGRALAGACRLGRNLRDPTRRRRPRGVRQPARRWRCASHPKHRRRTSRDSRRCSSSGAAAKRKLAAIDLSLPGQAVLKLRSSPQAGLRSPGAGTRCGLPPNGTGEPDVRKDGHLKD